MKATSLAAAILAGITLSGTPVFANEAATLGHAGNAAQVERTVRITTLDTRFDKKLLQVRAGETVLFVVSNTGKLKHEFVIGNAREQAAHELEMQQMGDMDMPDEPNAIMLKPGQTKTLIWTFGSERELEYACHTPGHYAAGMIGKISVTGKTK